MNLDPRWLGMFMILNTQYGWAKQLLPIDDDPVMDYKDTDFYKSGLETSIGELFQQRFGGTGAPSRDYTDALSKAAKSATQREMYRKLFDLVARVLKDSDTTYKPPACPRPETIKAVISQLNSEYAATMDPFVTLDRKEK